jgi:hypothetical protein
MFIDFKELNRLRTLRCRENFITKTYYIDHGAYQTLFKIVETPGFLFRSYWNERQNSLLEYLLENETKFKDKNILVLFDGVGFCGIVGDLIGAKVTICEEKEYWSLIETNIKNNPGGNIKLITPIEYEKENVIYDYVIISESIYNTNIFEMIRKDKSTKIILGMRKYFWETEKFIQKENSKEEYILSYFPKEYTRKQLTPMKSNLNVVFELEKKIYSWLEE